MGTNRKKLGKGLQYLAGALPLAFIGPAVIYSAFGNRDKFLYIPVLVFGILAAAAAVFLMFKGIRMLMRGFFDD